MAYIWGTGFETGSVESILRTNGRVDLGGQGLTVEGFVSGVGPKDGSYKCTLRESFGERFFGYLLETPIPEIWVGFWYRNAVGASNFRTQFTLSDGKIIYVRLYGGGMSVYVDGVLVVSGIIGYSWAVWTNFQIHLKVSDTGNVDTKVDGIDDIAYAGDTKPGSGVNITAVDFFESANYSYMDDIAIRDDDWTGDIRFSLLIPTADTADKDWLRSTGADNFSLIDEIPPNDGDYVYTQTNGDKDLYDITNYDDTNQTPLFVVQWLRARKNTANTQKVKMVTKSGATETTSSDLVLSTAYTYFMRVMDLDPDGAAWSNAVLDALLIGQESVM